VIKWDHSDTDIIIYSDDSMTSLGFMAPSKLIGFCTSVPNEELVSMIFYFKALMITSAVLWASRLTPPIQCLLIYTDSVNCVDMFNTLKAQEGYNTILLFVVCILMSSKMSLHIFHVPRADNSIADALSCHLPTTAMSMLPSLQIHHFQPPHVAMGWEE